MIPPRREIDVTKPAAPSLKAHQAKWAELKCKRRLLEVSPETEGLLYLVDGDSPPPLLLHCHHSTNTTVLYTLTNTHTVLQVLTHVPTCDSKMSLQVEDNSLSN